MRTARWIVWSWLAGAFVLAFSLNIVALRDKGWLERPPDPGDSQDYYNIALNVLAGRGFGTWWDDPLFRSVYREHNEDFRYSPILRRHGEYKPTTYHPPLLPLAMAGVFLVAGPELSAWLWTDAALVALAVALATSIALRLGGHLAAGLTAVLGSYDPARAMFAPAVMSEGLAMLGVTGLAWLLVRLIDRRRFPLALATGAVTGLLTLNRSVFLLWYPFLALLVAWCWTRGPNRRTSRRSVWLALGLFLLPAVLIPSPWWIRNCVVLERFMPLGTQGAIGLPVGYSDVAVGSGGLWSSPQRNQFWEEVRATEPLDDRVGMARYGQRYVLRWIVEHPAALPGLALSKAWNSWTWIPRYGWTLLAALPGLLLLRSRRELVVPWALVGINTLCVAVTYWALGRFLIPIVPLLGLLAAVGICAILRVPRLLRADSPDGRTAPG